jgi:transcriptional regulatory protein RtcR
MSASRKTVVIGLLGPTLDRGQGHDRWDRWRPTVSLCQHEDRVIDRLELLMQPKYEKLAEVVCEDVARVSPETRVRRHALQLDRPWDFEPVFAELYDFAAGYDFDTDAEDYLVHITTGTHVAQICLFLLTESRHFPARLVQTSPPRRRESHAPGTFQTIDLDLSRYDQLAQRFAAQQREGLDFLKSGIATRDPAFNRLIEQIEHVAIHSREPILLTGPTGAGKSQLARRIYELKQQRRQIDGPIVEVNCATLRGDTAMSTLFGHRKGAFTGATTDREGLLCRADCVLLFLDEVGELGPDEQTMLLRAIEDKRFLPVGGDAEVGSDFVLICGTNRDLQAAARTGGFREDLLARIDLWSFQLPGLAQRRSDIEPNIGYELQQVASRTGSSVRFNKEAMRDYLEFAHRPDAAWSANFRDLSASIRRMAVMAPAGRITVDVVRQETQRLAHAWQAAAPAADHEQLLRQVVGGDALQRMDAFDAIQLAGVIGVCRQSTTLSDAGRRLFAVSRAQRAKVNDADRLRKYLLRFGLSWDAVAREPQEPVGGGGLGPAVR